MSAGVRARSSGSLVVNQVVTPVPVDDLVNSVRKRVEKALPWFDRAAYKRETDRQEALLDEAQGSITEADRALKDYRKAHDLRLLAEYARADRERHE